LSSSFFSGTTSARQGSQGEGKTYESHIWHSFPPTEFWLQAQWLVQ
jgi:hypothetical protein